MDRRGESEDPPDHRDERHDPDYDKASYEEGDQRKQSENQCNPTKLRQRGLVEAAQPASRIARKMRILFVEALFDLLEDLLLTFGQRHYESSIGRPDPYWPR